jgi:FAD synthase
MKETITFQISVTFGRFNVPHFGHVELVQKMLDEAKQAFVFLSGSKSNNDFDTRAFLFRHLLRVSEVDLQRVKVLKAANPFEAIETTLKASKDVVITLGEDQSKLCEKLCATYCLGGQLNSRSGSSSQIRHLFDRGEFDFIEQCIYRDDAFATRLAVILRKEELAREKA